MYVYVINKDGRPLMPCSCAKAKHLLASNKARVLRKNPFTIKLLWDCDNNVQDVIGGMDTGSRFIGCAAITNGNVVYLSEIQLRLNISKKMLQRKMYRKNRRYKKTRYRKCRRNNRASSIKKGKIAPSILSKINSHIREKIFLESILPISRWNIEFASFDIHKLSNPDVEKYDYKNGRQKGFYNVKAYVLYRDNYCCRKCKSSNSKLNVHHIVFKSNEGSNSPDNLITLCETCHDEIHKGIFEICSIKSKTKHAGQIGIIKSQLMKRLDNYNSSYGYETKWKREQFLKLPKEHYYDAISICCEDGEVVEIGDILYLKKHVSAGDYKQTFGSHSQKKIPTRKLFGIRKFDLIKTWKGIGFVTGKRSDGYFQVSKLSGIMVGTAVTVKRNCERISARTTTLTERRRLDLIEYKNYEQPCA